MPSWIITLLVTISKWAKEKFVSTSIIKKNDENIRFFGFNGQKLIKAGNSNIETYTLDGSKLTQINDKSFKVYHPATQKEFIEVNQNKVDIIAPNQTEESIQLTNDRTFIKSPSNPDTKLSLNPNGTNNQCGVRLEYASKTAFLSNDKGTLITSPDEENYSILLQPKSNTIRISKGNVNLLESTEYGLTLRAKGDTKLYIYDDGDNKHATLGSADTHMYLDTDNKRASITVDGRTVLYAEELYTYVHGPNRGFASTLMLSYDHAQLHFGDTRLRISNHHISHWLPNQAEPVFFADQDNIFLACKGTKVFTAGVNEDQENVTTIHYTNGDKFVKLKANAESVGGTTYNIAEFSGKVYFDGSVYVDGRDISSLVNRTLIKANLGVRSLIQGSATTTSNAGIIPSKDGLTLLADSTYQDRTSIYIYNGLICLQTDNQTRLNLYSDDLKKLRKLLDQTTLDD